MSFNSAIYDHEFNETMLGDAHFRRKTMITAYESDVVEEEEEEYIDPDLLYHWDFSAPNYREEQVSKNPLFQLYEQTPTDTFRTQITDIYGQIGLNAYRLRSRIQANNNFPEASVQFPEGSFDNISNENLTFVFEYSMEGGFNLTDHTNLRDTPLFWNAELLYKFGSITTDETASGLNISFNGKDEKFYQRGMFNTPDADPYILQAFSPGAYQYYLGPPSGKFNHSNPTTQGLFPYCRNGKNHTIAFGYRTDPTTNIKYFFTYVNKSYFEIEFATTTLNLAKSLNEPLINIYEREGDGNVLLKYVKVYNRFLVADEIPELEERFPFLYHHIAGTIDYVNYNHANTTRALYTNNISYIQFNDNCPLYTRPIYNGAWKLTGADKYPYIWYEYELEIRNSTSTFGIEFFNVYTNTKTQYNTLTNNFFDATTWNGLCFGVDGNQIIKIKCGDTIITTTTTFPLNTRKYLSFAYTPTEVKFYFDKTLIATVEKSTDSSLWDDIETNSINNPPLFGVFNLGLSGNRAHFMVAHSYTEDRGLMNNSVL